MKVTLLVLIFCGPPNACVAGLFTAGFDEVTKPVGGMTAVAVGAVFAIAARNPG